MTRRKNERAGKSETGKEEETKNGTLSVSLLKAMVASETSKKHANASQN